MPPTTTATPWGRFDGNPVLELLDDGRSVCVLAPFRYTDARGDVWVAPVGLVCDGASIPRALWSSVGGPFEGRHRDAALLHDAAYYFHGWGLRSRAVCDRMFYEAMRCAGVGALKARVLYAAVRMFGGRSWAEDVEARLAEQGT